MPTYDYRCQSCGHAFEYFQSMSSETLKKCPECGKKLERIMGGGTGVIFKGSGFYQTDYKAKKADPAPACGAGACKTPEVCTPAPK